MPRKSATELIIEKALDRATEKILDKISAQKDYRYFEKEYAQLKLERKLIINLLLLDDGVGVERILAAIGALKNTADKVHYIENKFEKLLFKDITKEECYQ